MKANAWCIVNPKGRLLVKSVATTPGHAWDHCMDQMSERQWDTIFEELWLSTEGRIGMLKKAGYRAIKVWIEARG